MATIYQWYLGARPKTLPAALAPVIAACGLAIGDREFAFSRAVLALGVALALQVGTNYANDYSDGVKGTDSERVGPMRLVASGAAQAKSVKIAAYLSFLLAALLGLMLALLTTPWLLALGAASILAGWFYTGGPKPYGYYGFGELFVFVFFGLVAQWREERAIELDIPPRYLLSDLTVAAVAQLAPKSKQELLKVRGIDPRQITNGVDVTILEAVKEGLLLEKVPEIPHQNDDGFRGAGAIVSLCLSWLSQKCTDERFDSTIVGTREDVAQLLAGDKESRLASGWRYELVGKQLVDIKLAKLSLTGGPGGKIIAISTED